MKSSILSRREFVRRPQAWLLAALLAAFGTGGTLLAEVVKGPWLQNVQQTGITIMWETGQAGPAQLKYGEGTALTQNAPDAKEAKIHEVTLSGLKPATTYAYQVEGAEAATFKTAPAPGTPFTFASFGDTQNGPKVAAVAQATLARKPDILLHTGDIVETGGNYEQWGKYYFGPSAPLLRVTPVYPVIGSHDDVKSKDNIPQEYYDQFSLPGPKTEEYYSFEYSDALFLALRPEEMWTKKDSVQLKWLEETLKNDKHRWRVAFWHEPPFSTGPHGSSRWIRQNLCPVLFKHGVDLVFCGHNHIYERSKPIKDSALNPDSAVTFITDGGGGVAGAKIYTTGANFTEKAVEGRSFFVLVSINGDTLTGQTIDAADGKPFDEFTIKKTADWRAAYLAGAIEAKQATANYGNQKANPPKGDAAPKAAPKKAAPAATKN